MSFEAELLMQAFAVPLAVSAAIAWLLARFVQSKSIAILGKRIVVGHTWWLGAILALAFGAQTLHFDEKWQQAAYWLWLVILTSCITSTPSQPNLQWILSSLAVAIFLGASLPGGDGWQDMATTKYVGWLVGWIAWLANSALCSEHRSCAISKASYVWIVFVSQAALAICALSCYGSLGAWALSLTALAVSFTALVARSDNDIFRTVLWPIFAAGSLVALTAVLYGANLWPVIVALFMPTSCGMIDRLCQARSLTPTPRSWVAFIVSTAMLTIVIGLLNWNEIFIQ
jgi:hypothetical protein